MASSHRAPPPPLESFDVYSKKSEESNARPQLRLEQNMCRFVLHCCSLCCIVVHLLHCVALCCIYVIALHCVALLRIVLHCCALCCIVVHCVFRRWLSWLFCSNAFCCIVLHVVALCFWSLIELHFVALCCIRVFGRWLSDCFFEWRACTVICIYVEFIKLQCFTV